MKQLAIAAALAATALIASGCSQIDAYAPVSGVPKATIEVAIGDVLAAQQIPVLVRPECQQTNETFTCEGSTTTGARILATSTSVKPFTLTLTVGDATIYSGDAQDAINEAMRAR
jgi:hypothetical protein